MNLFTSEELYVLASLLGRDFIIGVEEKTYENNSSDLKGLFQKNYSALEARGVFEYRIDGTLLVDHDVKNAVKILNKADCVFVVVTNIRGSREKINFLKYGELYCRLTEKGSAYSLEVMEEFNYGSILDSFGIRLSGVPLKELCIPMTSLKEINDLYNSFSQSDADRMLAELIQDPGTEDLIRECLLRKNGSFVMKEYRRIRNTLSNNNSLILRITDDFILDFSVNDGINVMVRIYRKE